MGEVSQSLLREDNCVEFAVPESILLTETFEVLTKECRSTIRKLSEMPTGNDGDFGQRLTEFMPFAKLIFDFQNEALRLLSWLKVTAKNFRGKPFNTQSVQSLLDFKRRVDEYESLMKSSEHLYDFTKQLNLFARPISLSATLPYFSDSITKSDFSHSFSPRTVLSKDCSAVLNLVENWWTKVGAELHSFGQLLNEPMVLAVLQCEISVISSVVLSTSEKTDTIYLSTKCSLIEVVNKAVCKELKVAHIRLKKASWRLDGVQKLIEHLEGDKARWPWFDFSPNGVNTLQSSKIQVEELASRIHETWLRQLELRELFKLVLSTCEPNQPNPVELSFSNETSTSLPLSRCSTTEVATASAAPIDVPPPADDFVTRSCLCNPTSAPHPMRTSKSAPCLWCLQVYHQPASTQRRHHYRCRRYFTSSGESGFVSDSDNVRLRRRRCQQQLPDKLLGCLDHACVRSLSFPLPGRIQNLVISSLPCETSKDESCASNPTSPFEESTPVKSKQQHSRISGSYSVHDLTGTFNHSKLTMVALSPIAPAQALPINQSHRCPSLVSDSMLVGLTENQELEPYNSTFSLVTSTDEIVGSDAESDDNTEAGGACLETEEDSAFITSPTSFYSHSDASSSEVALQDGDIFAQIYHGGEQKKRLVLSRSLPSLAGEWLLRSQFDKPGKDCKVYLCLEKPSQVEVEPEMSTVEAYAPLTMLSETATPDDDSSELSETGAATSKASVSTSGGGIFVSSFQRPRHRSCQGDDQANWSPISCQSEDLADLAAALRLSPGASERFAQVLRKGSDLVAWLADLEHTIYRSSPVAGASSSPRIPKRFHSSLLSRLRPDCSRHHLEKLLSQLKLNTEEVERWRLEVNTLFREQKDRLAELQPEADKLLISDRGSLPLFPAWLDMISSRCDEVGRELRWQLRVRDYVATLSGETDRRLQELADQAEPAIAEAHSLVRQLGGTSSQRHSHCEHELAITALVPKLQDLLERASELDPSCCLMYNPSVESLSDNQILRARLRSCLAGLNSLLPLPVPHPAHVTPAPTKRPLRWRLAWCLTALGIAWLLLPFLILLLYHAFTSLEVEARRTAGTGSCCSGRVLCFATVMSQSLCVIVRSLLALPANLEPQPPPPM